MIKTPVIYRSDSENMYDKNGSWIAHISKRDLAEEIVKRINMYDELVAALKHVKRVMALPENIEIEIDNLLERCK